MSLMRPTAGGESCAAESYFIVKIIPFCSARKRNMYAGSAAVRRRSTLSGTLFIVMHTKTVISKFVKGMFDFY